MLEMVKNKWKKGGGGEIYGLEKIKSKGRGKERMIISGGLSETSSWCTTFKTKQDETKTKNENEKLSTLIETQLMGVNGVIVVISVISLSLSASLCLSFSLSLCLTYSLALSRCLSVSLILSLSHSFYLCLTNSLTLSLSVSVSVSLCVSV